MQIERNPDRNWNQAFSESYYQGDQMIRKKIAKFLKELPKKLPSQKKAKTSTTKLNLKAQNIYIKPLLKP